jgi:membrane-associated HD superfamily phosphohydrolase
MHQVCNKYIQKHNLARIILEEMTSFLDILGWPIKVVDGIRQVLLSINIQLPAVLAQALICVIFILMAYTLRKKALAAETPYIKLAAYSVMTAALIGVVSIVYVWADYVIWPRNKEVIGTIVLSDDSKPSIELIDNVGQALAANAYIDSQGNFSIRISPVFADPPAKLRVQQSGCKSREYLIRRNHLLGELMQISWSCDAP